MQTEEISKLSEEINAKVAEAERGLADITFNPYVDQLYTKEIDLVAAEEDLSDVLMDRVRRLSRKGVSPSVIAKLLRESAHARYVSLNVVQNEIASVIVGQIEIGLSSDTVRKVKALSKGDFESLKKQTRAKFPQQDVQSITMDCRLDRWVLVVDEDKFTEKSELALKNDGHEI